MVRKESVLPAAELGASIRWLGLGDIAEGTGEFEIKIVPVTDDQVRWHLGGGDILFLLRPNLRKVVLIGDDDEGGLCSGEIIVLRGLTSLSTRPAPEWNCPRRLIRNSSHTCREATLCMYN